MNYSKHQRSPETGSINIDPVSTTYISNSNDHDVERLRRLVLPWVEQALVHPIANPSRSKVLLRPVPLESKQFDFFALRIDEITVASVREDWFASVHLATETLHPDLFFSELGAYEISRVTIEHGVAVLLPTPCFFADEQTWVPVVDDRPIELNSSEISQVNWDTFIHCGKGKADKYFGIYEDGALVALAGARFQGGVSYGINVDVVPESQSRGLGNAVLSAAGSWAVGRGGVLFATAAIWNIPSGRNLRKLGMKYLYSTMISQSGPFLVSPQPLGEPIPGATIYDRYAHWAKNHNILSKEDIDRAE